LEAFIASSAESGHEFIPISDASQPLKILKNEHVEWTGFNMYQMNMDFGAEDKIIISILAHIPSNIVVESQTRSLQHEWCPVDKCQDLRDPS
jgi:hypothetical protein